MTSHADTHDRNKLERWHKDLFDGPADTFPAYAVFLVSADNQAAHAIFRRFRDCFESRQAAFAHLVIFGQHGISDTTSGLLKALSLTENDLPTLALFTSPYEAVIYTLPLPTGDDLASDQQWQSVLSLIEDASDTGEEDIVLDSIPGVTRQVLGAMFPLDITDMAGRVLQGLGSSPKS